MPMPFLKKTFPNNLRVIVAPLEGTKAVTLLVLVKTGSKYEIKRTNGVSHFLEHLFFKGTKHRPNAGDVHKELDRIGAEHNAFTDKEMTGYWVKTASKHFDVALDIISDILIEPLFKAGEIELERGVILQELSMYEDNPQRKVFEVWEELLYGDQPAGWPIGGTIETMKGITRDDIVSYRDRQYKAKNTIVIVAGNIDPEKTFEKVERAFQPLPVGHPEDKIKTEESQKEPAMKLFYKDTDQTHLILGVRAYDKYDDRRYALGLLSSILGGNTSSRLFINIREKLGLAYYVSSATALYTDTGYLMCRAGVRHDALAKTVEKIIEELKSLANEGPSEEEVQFAKDNLRGSLALELETSDDIAHFYGDHELFYDTVVTPEEVLKKFEEVTKNDIIKVAREIILPEKLNLSVVGPHKEFPFAEMAQQIS